MSEEEKKLFEKVKKFALAKLQLFTDDKSSLTSDTIEQCIDEAFALICNNHKDLKAEAIDKERLFREINHYYSVSIEPAQIITDTSDHVPWLEKKKTLFNWNYWNSYRQFLGFDRGFPEGIVEEIDRSSDLVLGNLEDPSRKGTWDRRGMVVGQVQSGKTGNYTALICKAVDVGYKLIIVLSGTRNDLRSQTQGRLDREFLGFDTSSSQENRNVGVYRYRAGLSTPVHSLTSSIETGDFRRTVQRNVNFVIGSEPVFLVMKKNTHVLKSVLSWLKSQRRNNSGCIEDVPLLLIDDEADLASVNGRPASTTDDEEPSRINRHVRELLSLFGMSSYVGYTATPFANIFILDNTGESRYGEDLFPRSFIVSLKSPSNYMGPSRLFGSESDSLESPVNALPLIRYVDDYEEFIPNRHDKNFVPQTLPESLKDAIKHFILVIAARNLRDQNRQHNSMMIHVTRFVNVQSIVFNLVDSELGDIQRKLRYSLSNESILEKFRQIWESDFACTTEAIKRSTDDTGVASHCWDAIKEELTRAALSIKVKELNGTSSDALDYWKHTDGLNVVAIGGDKLSRGLTLEGLSVSYYLRATRMYDTLLQMGRWFGYKDGFIDLCRLFTTREIVQWYQFVSEADEELRTEFDYMVRSGLTPADYGLKVKVSPSGLQITSANKIASGTKMKVGFGNSLVETVTFSKSEHDIIIQNFNAVVQLTEKLGKPVNAWSETPGYVWSTGYKSIIDFLHDFETHPLSTKARTDLLREYILKMVASNELTAWTVVLISKSNEGKTCRIGDLKVSLISRTPDDTGDSETYILKKRHLISPADESIDMRLFFGERYQKAVMEHRKFQGTDRNETVSVPGRVIRKFRPEENGLLLLYPLDSEVANAELPFSEEAECRYPFMSFAISFPDTDNEDALVEYEVNPTYYRQLFGEEDEF